MAPTEPLAPRTTDELSGPFSKGKLARASGRFLVAENHFTTVAVSCRVRIGTALSGDQIQKLCDESLAAVTAYALALARSLAASATPPERLQVHAECDFATNSALSDLSLRVHGDVPGIDPQTFEAAARDPATLQVGWASPPTGSLEITANLIERAVAETDLASEGVAEPPGELPSAPVAAAKRKWARMLILVALAGAGIVLFVLLRAPESQSRSKAVADQPEPDTVAAPAQGVTAGGVADTTAAPLIADDASSDQARAAVETPRPTVEPPPAPTSVAAGAAVSAALPTPTLVPPTAEPALEVAAFGPFVDSFANNSHGWPNDPQSTAWLEGGGYHLAPRQASQFVAVRAPVDSRFADLTVTAVFEKLGGPEGGGYGLILRDQSQTPLDGLTQTGQYYVFEVGDRGDFGIWRREGTRWIDILPWTRSPAVVPGIGSNELVAQARGTQLDFLVNGVLVTTQRDAVLPDGYAGIFAGGDGNHVQLKRFAVQPLT